MVAGHLQEKKSFFYIVPNYKDEEGKRKSKWMATGLPVKRSESLLMDARKNLEFKPNEETEKVQDKHNNKENSDVDQTFFADYMLDWLKTVKHRIELITYISYANAVKGRIVPYFREKSITLLELKPHHIQDFYSRALNEWGVSTNTVIHYHANIRSALQQAFITDRITSNPADKIIRPKKEAFVGSSYSASEVNQLLEIVKGTRIELLP